jgi:hypothetical protein
MDEPKPTDDISEALAQRRWRQLLMVSDDVLLQIADQFRDGREEALVTFDRADPLDLTHVSRAEFDRLVAERPVSVPQVATTDVRFRLPPALKLAVQAAAKFDSESMNTTLVELVTNGLAEWLAREEVMRPDLLSGVERTKAALAKEVNEYNATHYTGACDYLREHDETVRLIRAALDEAETRRAAALAYP